MRSKRWLRRMLTGIAAGRTLTPSTVRNAFDSDLMDLKYSALGQAILAEAELPADLRSLSEPLRKVLQRI